MVQEAVPTWVTAPTVLLAVLLFRDVIRVRGPPPGYGGGRKGKGGRRQGNRFGHRGLGPISW